MSQERERVERAVGAVLFNASNFPERAQSRIWGQDMGPLREKITFAVLGALGLCACVEDVVCVTCMTSATPPAGDVREALRGEPLALSLFRMFVREHDQGDGPERVLVEVADIRHVLRLLDVRPRGTVTDTKVAAALDAYLDGAEPLDWQPGAMRAALKAAMENDS